MSVQLNANSLFAPAWNDKARTPQKETKTDLEKAMERFAKAQSACDRAAETMMDEHHKTVAESAKKRDEYYKKKMLQDQAQEAARDREELSGQVRIESVNHRAMQEAIRLEERERERRAKA